MKLLGLLFFPLFCAASGFDVYLGDSNPYRTTAMVSDSAGNTYVTGGRVFGGLLDVFVAKVDPSGTVLFTTTTGGKCSDTATSIAVDPSGDIWVGGNTTSPDFPLVNSVLSQPSSVGTTGFILELAPNGVIVFSSYFGGTRASSSVNGIAADASGNGYVTGVTLSSDFPVTAGMPDSQASGGVVYTVSGAFIAKIAAGGAKILYSGLIAGGQSDCEAGSTCFLADKNTSGVAIAVDAAGNAYFAGNTDTINLPVTAGAFNPTGLGAFAGKVKADGSGLSYLTYVGNLPQTLLASSTPVSPNTVASSITVDAGGNAYVAGWTSDPNFPATAGAFQTAYGSPAISNPFQQSPADAFVAKLMPDGSAVRWATYLGGSGADAAHSIALDGNDNVWLAGTTGSTNFPNASGWSEGADFLVELNSSGSALPFSARYPNDTVSTAVALDASGLVHAAGVDGIVSAFVPSALPASEVFGIANAAAGYVTGRIVPGEVISIYGRNIGPGAYVSIGGYPAPLLYVSQWQINAVVPVELAPVELQGSTATVQIALSSGESAAFAAVVSPAEPGIFTNSNGTNSNGTNSNGVGVFSDSNSFEPGSVLSMWVTGIDLADANVADGQIPAAAENLEFPTQLQVLISALSNEPPVPANILYAGSAPGLVNGVVQINFQVPASGFGAVTLEVSGRSSPAVE